MNFEKLLGEKKIEKIKEDKNPDFSNCYKDIEFAKMALKNSADWSASVSYNSVVRAGNKLMFFLGYRAVGKEHHKNLFEFLKEAGLDFSLINYFDRVRRKRNDFIYRDKTKFSEQEAREILEKAEEFVLKIRTFVLKDRTDEKRVENEKGNE